MNLQGWPIPPKNNGIGHHFGDMTVANFDRWLPDIKALHVKWLVLASQSEGQIGRVAERCYQEDIMPIARPIRVINGGADFGLLASRCKTRYIQIFNEADLWRKDIQPDNWEEIYLRNWVAQAHKVRGVGCLPGYNAMSPQDVEDMLIYMKANGDDGLFPDMWLALHLYPPLVKPPLHAEWPYVCGPNCTEHPEFAPRGFEAFAAASTEVIGYPLPMIVTEGGLTDGMANAEYRGWWMVSVYSCFMDGTFPDYLLAWCPFMLADEYWHGFSWLTNERHRTMVEAVKAMGEWERGKPAPLEPQIDWRVVSSWMTEAEARGLLEDLSAAGLGFDLEERK